MNRMRELGSGSTLCDLLSSPTLKLICIGASGLVAVGIVITLKNGYDRRQRRKQWDNAGKDVVVLHQFPRAKRAPNSSPWPMKLETFLRAAKIKYVSEFEENFSSKGKCPWITINGQDIADSQLSMEYLARHFGVDFDQHLSKEEAAVARAFRVMIEERFFWCIAMDIFCFNDPIKALKFANFPGTPLFLQKMIVRGIKTTYTGYAKAHGIGRHSRAEVEALGVQDLQAVSAFLGDKKYLMGDQICTADFTLFGFTSMILHCLDPASVYRKAVDRRFKNLETHALSMKEKYWPDWDKLCNN